MSLKHDIGRDVTPMYYEFLGNITNFHFHPTITTFWVTLRISSFIIRN